MKIETNTQANKHKQTTTKQTNKQTNVAVWDPFEKIVVRMCGTEHRWFCLLSTHVIVISYLSIKYEKPKRVTLPSSGWWRCDPLLLLFFFRLKTQGEPCFKSNTMGRGVLEVLDFIWIDPKPIWTSSKWNSMKENPIVSSLVLITVSWLHTSHETLFMGVGFSRSLDPVTIFIWTQMFKFQRQISSNARERRLICTCRECHGNTVHIT